MHRRAGGKCITPAFAVQSESAASGGASGRGRRSLQDSAIAAGPGLFGAQAGCLICPNHIPGAWLTARANRHDALQPPALVFFFFSRLLRRNLGKGNRVPILEGADFAKVLEFRLRRTWLTGNCRIWLNGDRSGFRRGVGCTDRCRGRLLRLRRIWLNGDRSGFRRGVGRTNRCRSRLLRGRLLSLGRPCLLRDANHARQEIIVDCVRVVYHIAGAAAALG